jgi:hypothetical protein
VLVAAAFPRVIGSGYVDLISDYSKPATDGFRDIFESQSLQGPRLFEELVGVPNVTVTTDIKQTRRLKKDPKGGAGFMAKELAPPLVF